jgi:chemotaxis protein MotB
MRRGRRQHAEEHVNHERWLVSYADFITLLFGFFVVLFASVYHDNQSIIKLSHAIHAGFTTLGAFSGGYDEGNAPSGPNQAAPVPAPAETEQDIAAAQPDLAELRHELESAMGDELKKNEVHLRVTPEGFVISLQELGFFDSGQADLLPGAAAKIQRIAKILSRHGLDLRVEGHSDNQPIHNAQFANNWELSTARAMNVLLLIVSDSDFDPKKISVAGYAQYRPIADDSTPEGRRLNRRVDLVVVGTTPPPSSRLSSGPSAKPSAGTPQH